MMLQELKHLLDEVESSLDHKHLVASRERLEKSLDYRPVDRLPLVISYPLPDRVPYTPFTVEETFDDPEKMLFNQFLTAWDTSLYCKKWLKDDLPYTVRANFGTILIPSMLGAEYAIVGDNPPWVKNFASFEEFSERTKGLVFDPSNAFLKKVIDVYGAYKDILSGYPGLQSVVKVTLPDLQGPLSNYEQLRGSAMYTDFYERPDFVQEKLRAFAVYQTVMARYLIDALEINNSDWSYQHGHMIKGHILIRNDALALISGDIYDEFASEADASVLKALGGGGIHSCGKFDHTIDAVLQVDHLTCIDLGQSRMNDMGMVYEKAGRLKIPLIRVEATRDELDPEDMMKRYPTGVTLRYEAETFEDAIEVCDRYRGC